MVLAFAYTRYPASPTGRSGPLTAEFLLLQTLTSILTPSIHVQYLRSSINNGAADGLEIISRYAERRPIGRATTRCTCICSCTILESYPSVRVGPILALTCINAERTSLSGHDTLSDLAFFTPCAQLRGVESCSSSSLPAVGQPADTRS
jgi:hypothetical protein